MDVEKKTTFRSKKIRNGNASSELPRSPLMNISNASHPNINANQSQLPLKRRVKVNTKFLDLSLINENELSEDFFKPIDTDTTKKTNTRDHVVTPNFHRSHTPKIPSPLLQETFFKPISQFQASQDNCLNAYILK